MAERFVEVDRNTPMLLPAELRDWVPEDDLVHFVIEAVKTLPTGGSGRRAPPNAKRRAPNAKRRTPSAKRQTPNAKRRTPMLSPPLFHCILIFQIRRSPNEPEHSKQNSGYHQRDHLGASAFGSNHRYSNWTRGRRHHDSIPS